MKGFLSFLAAFHSIHVYERLKPSESVKKMLVRGSSTLKLVPVEETRRRSMELLQRNKGNVIYLSWRCIQLCIIFGPLAIAAPVCYGLQRWDGWYGWVVECLERAGATFIKLGQWASTRPDVFPVELCDALKKLHRNSSVHDIGETERILAEEGLDIEIEIERLIGSGCIAQVYQGKWNGQEVAVKVRHPRVETQIHTDLLLMYSFANVLGWIPSMQWLDLPFQVLEFVKIMVHQLDMRNELQNLKVFNENFKRDPQVRAFISCVISRLFFPRDSTPQRECSSDPQQSGGNEPVPQEQGATDSGSPTGPLPAGETLPPTQEISSGTDDSSSVTQDDQGVSGATGEESSTEVEGGESSNEENSSSTAPEEAGSGEQSAPTQSAPEEAAQPPKIETSIENLEDPAQLETIQNSSSKIGSQTAVLTLAFIISLALI